MLGDEMRAAMCSIIVLVAVFTPQSLSELADIRMCYFRSSARNRGNKARFDVKNIDFTLCTHYIYAYAIIDNTTKKLVASDPGLEDGPNGLYRQFVDGKKTTPSIKTMISVGTNYRMFRDLGDKPHYVDAFAASVVPFLNQRGFDGLDVDWIFPNSPNDKNLLIYILMALRSEFDKNEGSALVLTSTGEAIEKIMESGNRPAEIAKYVDFTIIKTQNMTFEGQTYAYFLGPLFARVWDGLYFSLCMTHSVHAWKRRGMPYNKMVMGISMTGSLLRLESASEYKPGSKIIKQLTYGPLYYMGSSLAYPEICQLMYSSKRYFDTVQMSPYLVRGETWIGYEDQESIKAKLDWMKTTGIAGIMVEALDHDDFTGTMCNQGPNPMLSFLKSYQQSIVSNGQTTTTTVIPNVGSSVDPSVDTTTPVDTDPIINTASPKNIEPEKNTAADVYKYSALAALPFLCCIFLLLVLFCYYRKRKRGPQTEDEDLARGALSGSQGITDDVKRPSRDTAESSVDE